MPNQCRDNLILEQKTAEGLDDSIIFDLCLRTNGSHSCRLWAVGLGIISVIIIIIIIITVGNTIKLKVK